MSIGEGSAATRRPRMTITGPVIDSGDPIGLARFYERLLGWTIVEHEGPRPGCPAEDGWAKVRAPDGSWGVTGSGEVHVFAEGRRVDLDGLPRTLNPDAGF